MHSRGRCLNRLTRQPPLHGTTTLPASSLNLHPGCGEGQGSQPSLWRARHSAPPTSPRPPEALGRESVKQPCARCYAISKDTKRTARNPSPPPPPLPKLHWGTNDAKLTRTAHGDRNSDGDLSPHQEEGLTAAPYRAGGGLAKKVTVRLNLEEQPQFPL